MKQNFSKHSNLMAWGQALCEICCQFVYITRQQSMKIPVSLCISCAMANKRILVDSGATDNFIDPHLIKCLGLGTQPLEHPRKIWESMEPTIKQACQPIMLTWKYV